MCQSNNIGNKNAAAFALASYAFDLLKITPAWFEIMAADFDNHPDFPAVFALDCPDCGQHSGNVDYARAQYAMVC